MTTQADIDMALMAAGSYWDVRIPNAANFLAGNFPLALGYFGAQA